MIAKRIRDFIDTLFPNRELSFLMAELAEARKERDYFKTRAERLELRLLPENVRIERRKRSGVTELKPRSWPEVQRLHAQKLAEEEAKEKQAANG